MTAPDITLTAGNNPVTVLVPSNLTNSGWIQNTGTNPARIVIDGGIKTKGCVDPAASTGLMLAANGGIVNLADLIGQRKMPLPPVRAYSAAGTTLSVGTDDNLASIGPFA